jgi:hypothetical protein
MDTTTKRPRSSKAPGSDRKQLKDKRVTLTVTAEQWELIAEHLAQHGYAEVSPNTILAAALELGLCSYHSRDRVQKYVDDCWRRRAASTDDGFWTQFDYFVQHDGAVVRTHLAKRRES